MRILVAVLLLIGGLLGLFMTACGGIITIMSISDRNSTMSFWVISVPSLIVGVLLLRFVASRYVKWRDAGQGTPPMPPPA